MRILVYWLPPLLWMALIFKLSNGAIPAASPIYWQDFAFKKLAHMFFYGVLALLFYRALVAYGLKKEKALVWSFIYSVLYGVTDEYHQSFSEGREARVRDVGFDALGAAIFALALKWQGKY